MLNDALWETGRRGRDSNIRTRHVARSEADSARKHAGVPEGVSVMHASRALLCDRLSQNHEGQSDHVNPPVLPNSESICLVTLLSVIGWDESILDDRSQHFGIFSY